jgi:hypothetical protein
MKKQLLAFITSFTIIAINQVQAQCDFTPKVVQSTPALCPNGKDTILVTDSYDSYQWYKNGRLIPGATKRFYVAHQFQDAESFFKVEVTKNGCTTFSNKVFVDQYAFLPPYFIETGDIGVYNPYLDALVECPRDTLTLVLGTYILNVQWYNNFKPIPGATTDTFVVTSNGSYTACGSPVTCPSFVDCQALPVNVIFDTLNPVITQRHDTLYASKAKSYQWLYNGKIIAGATNNFFVPSKSGTYKVAVNDKYKCALISESFVYNGFKKETIIVAPNPVHDVMHLRIKTNDGVQLIVSDLFGNRLMQVPVTNAYQTVIVSNLHPGTYMLQLLNKEKLVIGSGKIFKQ